MARSGNRVFFIGFFSFSTQILPGCGSRLPPFVVHDVSGSVLFARMRVHLIVTVK